MRSLTCGGVTENTYLFDLLVLLSKCADPPLKRPLLNFQTTPHQSLEVIITMS